MKILQKERSKRALNCAVRGGECCIRTMRTGAAMMRTLLIHLSRKGTLSKRGLLEVAERAML